MRRAGFVLVGGQSSRMGRDKALLPYQGRTLAEHIASIVLEAAGSVTLIGSPGRYGGLGFPVYDDDYPDRGPIGGVATALRVSGAEWNLVVACDMPAVTAGLLRALLDRARDPAGCVAATGPDGEPEPLCAVYHARSLPVIERAIRDNRLKMKELMKELQPVLYVEIDPGSMANLNTPKEWAELQEKDR
jgi:molybdopterin-guanine dinucleotide biosynthesis protein A